MGGTSVCSPCLHADIRAVSSVVQPEEVFGILGIGLQVHVGQSYTESQGPGFPVNQKSQENLSRQRVIRKNNTGLDKCATIRLWPGDLLPITWLQCKGVHAVIAEVGRNRKMFEGYLGGHN